MSKDFIVNRIATLPAGELFSLQGIQAIRNATSMSYKMSRVVLSAIALDDAETVFPVAQALGAEEVRVVTVDGTPVETPAGYTVGDGDPDPVGAIVLASAPTEGQVVIVRYESAVAATLPAGTVTWIEHYSDIAPDAFIPTDEEVVEVC